MFLVERLFKANAKMAPTVRNMIRLVIRPDW